MLISTWPSVWVLLVQFHQLCPSCVVFLDGGVCFLYQQHHWPIQTWLVHSTVAGLVLVLVRMVAIALVRAYCVYLGVRVSPLHLALVLLPSLKSLQRR
jgi:hypothetical protein